MLLWILLLGSIEVVFGAAPQVVSAEYEIQQVEIGTYSIEYAQIDVEFDQDIYLPVNWACPCTSSASCPGNVTTSSFDPGPGVQYTDLVENTLLETEILWGQQQIYRVNVQPSASLTCPHLEIIVNISYGNPSFFVSTSTIPTQFDYMWRKQFYNQDRIKICYSDPLYSLGYYYIVVELQAPYNPNGYYSIYWKTAKSVDCLASPFVTSMPLKGILLLEGQKQLASVNSSGTLLEFHKLADCTNLTVSVRREGNNQITGLADVNLYITYNRNYTPINFYSGNHYDLQAATEGDDTIYIYDYCSNVSGQELVFYIHLFSYGVSEANVNVSVVASTLDEADLVPISSFGLTQAQYSLGVGTYQFVCGSSDTEILPCNTPASQVFETWGDYFSYCFPTYPIQSNDDPSPIFPYNGNDKVQFGFTNFITWNTSYFNLYTSANSTRPPNNRLTLVIAIEKYSQALNFFKKQFVNDVSTCKVNFFNRLVNSQFETVSGTYYDYANNMPIMQNYPITLAPPAACTYDMILSLISKRDAILDVLRRNTDALILQQADMDLAILHTSRAWRTCKSNLDRFFITNGTSTNTSMQESFSNQIVCPEEYTNFYTANFFFDTCCYSDPNSCCAGTDLNESVFSYTYIDTSSDSCRNPVCVDILSSDFIRKSNNIQDPVFGCNAKSSRFIEGGSLEKFIYDCQVATLGSDLLGVPCSSSSDCPYNGSCKSGRYGSRCLYRNEDILQCFQSTIDPKVAQYLTFTWGSSNLFGGANDSWFANQLLTRYVADDCTGENAIQYREHWFWTPFDVTCTDTCIPPRCFSYHDDCTVSQDCDTYTFCTYSWTPRASDSTGCVAEQACNWLDCLSYGLDDAACAAWCVNSSLSIGTCLDCSAGTSVTPTAEPAHFYCTELTNVTESECTTGFCSLDSSVSANDTCTALTMCSVTVTSVTVGLSRPSYQLDFPAATDNGTCVASYGACQSYADLQPLLDQPPWNTSGATGVCLSPVLDNYCYGAYPPILEGCPEDSYLDQLSCETAGFRWRTIATDEANCIAPVGCYNTQYQFVNGKNFTDCQACNRTNYPLVWMPIWKWFPAKFATGRIVQHLWVNRSYEPIRYIAPVVSFTAFRADVERAISFLSSLQYSSNEICRNEPFLVYLRSVLCDCDSLLPAFQCYSGKQNAAFEESYVCPYIATKISVNFGDVIFNNNSLTPSPFTFTANSTPCIIVSVTQSPSELFTTQIGSRIASEIFYDQPLNIYSNVYDLALLQGQIISNGLTVNYINLPTIVSVSSSFTNPFTVCVAIDQTLPVDVKFTHFAMAILRDDKIVQYYSPSPISVQYRYDSNLNASVPDKVCADVYEFGTYFAALTNPEFYSIRAGVLAMCAISSFFYFLCMIAAGYCVISFIFDYKHIQWFNLFICAVITLFALVRGAYWIIVATGSFYSSSAASYILFEFPTYLFLVMYSAMIYLWLEFLIRIKNIRHKLENRGARWPLVAFWLWSLFVLIVGVVFCIVYYTIPNEETNLPCLTVLPEVDSAKAKVSLGYVSTVAILGFILAMFGLAIAIGFNIVFYRLNRISNYSDDRKAKKKTQLFYALIVGFLFSVCFLAKSGIFIAFCVVQTISFPILVFAALEIVPTCALIFYVFPTNSRVYRVMSRSSGGDSGDGSMEKSSKKSTAIPLPATTASPTNSSNPENSSKIFAGAGSDPSKG